MIELRIFGGRIYFGLSGWALNPMTCPHKDETEGNLTDRCGGSETTEAEIGLPWPQIKEC